MKSFRLLVHLDAFFVTSCVCVCVCGFCRPFVSLIKKVTALISLKAFFFWLVGGLRFLALVCVYADKEKIS